MSLDNHKITTYQDNVSDLPDYPSDEGYTAAQLKAIFDGRTDKEIKEKVNALIDELKGMFTELEEADNNTEEKAKKYADNAVATHNKEADAHGDIRNLISELTRRLNAVADSDDTTLDQISELVAYIKDNRGLIEAVTTAKANVSDVYNRDTIDTMLGNYAPKNRYATTGEYGLVRFSEGYGITGQSGVPRIVMATDQQISNKLNKTNPIVPANLSYAVTSVGNRIYTTNEQFEEFKQDNEDKFKERDDKISKLEEGMGEMDTALDSVIASQESIRAMQNSLIGGDA